MSDESGFVGLLRRVDKKEGENMRRIWSRVCNSEKIVNSIILAVEESMQKFFSLLQLITQLFPIFYDEKILDSVLINLNMFMEGFFKN